MFTWFTRLYFWSVLLKFVLWVLYFVYYALYFVFWVLYLELLSVTRTSNSSLHCQNIGKTLLRMLSKSLQVNFIDAVCTCNDIGTDLLKNRM